MNIHLIKRKTAKRNTIPIDIIQKLKAVLKNQINQIECVLMVHE